MTTGMIWDPEVETRDSAQQRKLDEVTYRQQIAYLLEQSPFYQEKLRDAGFETVDSIGGLDDMDRLPFTTKDDIRRIQSEHPPVGNHLAADMKQVSRIFSTSGTTGVPCYIAVTKNDIDVWATHTARSYTAAGFRPGQRLVVTFNAGPFVAGAAYAGFDKLGCTVIPVGTGNTERLVQAVQRLGATAISCTPSYALYLIDWCHERGIRTETLGLTNIVTAGEPGGGDPQIRERIEKAFNCRLSEAMGIGDISTSIWGECEARDGMHFSGQGLTHVELIDPERETPIPFEDGAEGELVYTSLRREAMPLLRLRSRDHVTVKAGKCSCGRSSVRVRCIGRTDDMLIVRGVNLFPTAVRSLISEFAPKVGETFRIKPTRKGVSQEPPLPVEIELAEGMDTPPAGLAEKIEKAIRTNLIVTTKVSLVPYGTLPRSEYKTKLVDYSEAK